MLTLRNLFFAAAICAAGSVTAADFFVVVPAQGRSQPGEDVTVTLNAATIPAAQLKREYSFDFSSLLQVTGDKNFAPSAVKWSIPEGRVPSGLLFEGAVLKGTPTESTKGTVFTLVADYKSKTGRNVYRIVVDGTPLDVVQVSSGQTTTCAVTAAGGALCWGGQTYGSAPITPSGLSSGVASISTGSQHICALMVDTSVRCWGSNEHGQLGVADRSLSYEPIVTIAAGVKSLSAGLRHSCVVMENGSANCWGRNDFGQLGIGSTAIAWAPTPVRGLSAGVADVIAGRNNTCALMIDTSLLCWGLNMLGLDQLEPVEKLANGVIGASVGAQHACALLTTGDVMCWGSNSYGQLGNGQTSNSVTPVLASAAGFGGTKGISSGDSHTCAVTVTGAVWCWGANGKGQLGIGTTANNRQPARLEGPGVTVVSLSSGEDHTCAVASDRTAWCWGNNSLGQLGAEGSNAVVPVKVGE